MPIPELEVMPASRMPDDGDGFTPGAAPAHLHTPSELAADQDILARLVSALAVCGAVGEDRTAKLVYLALTSRLLPEPVSLAVKGVSSSGKSFTVETTMRFFPEDAYIAMTAMSERALVYMKEEFSHRTLVLFEAVALREQREKTESNLTAYFVRSLLSEGRIRYPVTVRGKDGAFVTKTIVKEGPTNLIVTTTAISLHGENETRVLSLPTNDTADQTAKIMLQLAGGVGAEPDFGEWHKLQVWLQRDGQRRVVIPYAACVARRIPPVAVRLRRDFKTLLRLIETHAILHQRSRDRDDQGRIVAEACDYLAVRELVADLVSTGVGAGVSETMRETVGAVRDLTASQQAGTKVLAVAGKLGLDRSAAQRRLSSAREAGYILNAEDRRGQAARYLIADPMPHEVVVLPEGVCTPCARGVCAGCDGVSAGQRGVCTCVHTAEGVKPRPHRGGQDSGSADGPDDADDEMQTSGQAAPDTQPHVPF